MKYLLRTGRSMTLSILALAFSSCMKDEFKSQLQSDTITYGYEISESLFNLVDCTIIYIDQERKPHAEKMNSHKWDKTIQATRPFYAEMQIKCERKTTAFPNKDYYKFYRKLTINESVSYSENVISKRGFDEYIDNLCKKTQILFFEIK